MTIHDLTPEAAVRAALKTQYHAALAMLRQAIELCPDAIWRSDEHRTSLSAWPQSLGLSVKF